MTTTYTNDLPVLLPFEPPLNRDGSQGAIPRMPLILYPFDLERAIAGDPVITRDGQRVTGLSLERFNARAAGQLRGQLNNGSTWWHNDGRFSAGTDTNIDLFMATAPPSPESLPASKKGGSQ
jgi:hypothetical protein